MRIKRRARQKTECRHPSVAEAPVADTLILMLMTTQQRNYREKNYKGLKIFKAKDANKAREGGGRQEERARREDQIILLEQNQAGKAGMLRKSTNRKPDVAWSPNVSFIFEYLITSKVNSWYSNHRDWASTLGLR